MATTAFEAITTRQAWYATAVLEKYTAAEFGVDGNIVAATGAGQFAGIVQYSNDVAGNMVTVVKGMFPTVASVAITKGDKVTIDAANAGKFKVAATGNTVYGTAMNTAAAGDLFTVAMSDVTKTV